MHHQPPPAHTNDGRMPQQLPAVYALHHELYNVNDALRILSSVANYQQSLPQGISAVQPVSQNYPIFAYSYPQPGQMYANGSSCYQVPMPPVPQALHATQTPVQSVQPLQAPQLQTAQVQTPAKSPIESESGPEVQAQTPDASRSTSDSKNISQLIINDRSPPAEPENQDQACDSQRNPQSSQFDFERTQLVTEGHIAPWLVVECVRFFFQRIEPYFPFVHQQFSDPKILAKHEVLLTTICAISCKYIHCSDGKSTTRRLGDRSCELIADMCRRACFNFPPDERKTAVAAVALSIALHQEWPVGDFSGIEQYNQGGIVQLAMGCQLASITEAMDGDPNLYVGMHTLDMIISCRLGRRQSILGIPNYGEMPLANKLTLRERARLDVTRLLGLAMKTMFESREATRQAVTSGSFLAMLNLIDPQFELWKQEYKEILISEDWRARSVVFEFHHCQLYVYSLAIVTQQNEMKRSKASDSGKGSGGNEQSWQIGGQSLKYVMVAIEAALAIIEFETNAVPVNIDAAPSMRWIVRFIHATVFLAKAVLCPPLLFTSEIKQRMLASIDHAAEAMKRAGADNFHLMSRYIDMMSNLRDQMKEMSAQIAATEGVVSDQETHGDLTTPPAPFLAATDRPPSFSPNSSTSSVSRPRSPETVGAMSLDANLLADSNLSFWDMLEHRDTAAGVDNTMLFIADRQINNQCNM